MALAAGIMFLGSAVVSSAQGPGGRGGFGGPGGQGMGNPEEMAKMRVERMKESLKLTDDQAAKLLDVFKQESEEMAKMFQGGGQGRMDQDAMADFRKKQDEAVKKILTADQYKAYTEQQQRRGPGGPGGPGGGPGGPGGPGRGNGGPGSRNI